MGVAIPVKEFLEYILSQLLVFLTWWGVLRRQIPHEPSGGEVDHAPIGGRSHAGTR